jgi:DNA-directed RNA polymerase subunit E'
VYQLYVIRDVVRVPPKEFGADLNEAVLKIAQQDFEGIVDEELGIVVCVKDVLNVGDGKVIPGDGAAYYLADLEMVAFKPELQEVVGGKVTEITEFGAFVKIGPMEGLVHVSQIMDDYINHDAKNG